MMCAFTEMYTKKNNKRILGTRRETVLKNLRDLASSRSINWEPKQVKKQS